MEKREQDILDKINVKTKNIEIPEQISPENIEALLNERQRKKRKSRTVIYRIGGLAAACVVLIAGIAVLKNIRLASSYDMGTETAAITESSDTGADRVAENTTEADSETATVKNAVKTANSYDEIYAYIDDLNSRRKEKEISLMNGLDMGMEEMAVAEVEDSTSAVSTDSAVSGSADYSTTNIRQEGVDEADTVKTDGTYLYVLKDNGKQIAIVDTRNNLKQAGEITTKGETNFVEFYVLPEEKKMVVIRAIYEEEDSDTRNEDDMLPDNLLPGGSTIEAVTYDIKDPENPKKVGSISQSGYYTSSRVSEGCLYLFTSYNVGNGARKDKPGTFVPLVNKQVISEDCIYLPPFERGCMYKVITAVDLKQPSKVSDSKAIFADGGELYVSNENIYYYETQWTGNDDTEETVIQKIGYKDGSLKQAVQGSIKGYINDTFSIDEYKGNLRIVSTVGDTNSVYVLDKALDITGSIEGLAKDERIYSARFMGDTGYFVTFRETDPLFSVDLSDPKNPKIIGQLKIPGFSEYLHFYGENKLLGIGMDVDGDSAVTNGVKLSMFDISDNTNVKEENKFVIKNVYSSSAFDDYKAVLIDVDRNMIGFAGYEDSGENYYLFSYDEQKGFKCNLSEEINGTSWRSARGVYIADTLYVIQGNIIEAYSLKDYMKVDDLIL